jgi:uncharacterized membrane protein YuzA (DUF378 family)
MDSPPREAAAKRWEAQSREESMKKLDVICALLLVVGGLNWGLVGAAQFDLVATLFGSVSPLSRIVYVLVGLAAGYQALQWRGIQRRWLKSTQTARA